MFNAELKKEFISQYSENENVRRNCRSVFAATEKYEIVWNADICTQPSSVLQPVVSDLLGLRSVSIYTRERILRQYALWCIQSNVPGATDGLLNVAYENDKIITKTVRNPKHLQMYLDSFCQPESEETVDNITRCFVWLAYAGVLEDDCLKIKAGDIDFSDMVIKLDGFEYPIYREAVPAFRKCVHLTAFKINRHSYSKAGFIFKDRLPGDLLLRSYKGTLNLYFLMNAYAKLRARGIRDGGDNLGINASYRNIWLSGQFYRTYELELIGVRPNFISTAEFLMQKRDYTISEKNNRDAIRASIMNDYLDDYYRWKKPLNTMTVVGV